MLSWTRLVLDVNAPIIEMVYTHNFDSFPSQESEADQWITKEL